MTRCVDIVHISNNNERFVTGKKWRGIQYCSMGAVNIKLARLRRCKCNAVKLIHTYYIHNLTF